MKSLLIVSLASLFRSRLGTFRLAGGLVFAALLLAPVYAGAAKRNVVVMIADDLGYGDVSCLSGGVVQTPNLDRLAGAGVKFTAGYVTAPLCAPSRAGFFTGLYQQRFGILNNDHPTGIPTDVTLLPGMLHSAGYRTALMGKWHSAGPMPWQRDCFDETLTAPKQGPWVDCFNPALLRNGKPEKRQGYISDILAQEAEAFIERNRSRPFALTITFNAPHIGPIKQPHDKIREAYDAARAAGRVYDAPKTTTAPPNLAGQYAAQFPGDTTRADTAATIAALDQAVGRILDKLQASGLTGNTAVFFFADNGGHPENRSENGVLHDYKWSHYEGGIRVPFLAASPGVFPAGLAYNRPVSTLDIYPTVAALAGVAPPSRLDGVNLVPYLTGERTGSPHPALFFLTGDKGAVVQDHWKLVVMPRGAIEIYDLAKDPGETNNLAATQPDRTSELVRQWQAWKAQMPANPPRQKPQAGSKPNVLLLFSDQHNADALSCAGHAIAKTPNLDALAAQGVRFTRAYCQDAICVPSRVSIMTGLYPRTTGCLTNGDERLLDSREDLYPLHQALRTHGYRTAAFGKLHLGKGPLLRGWDSSATVLPLKAEPAQESYFDWIRSQGREPDFLRDWEGGQSDLFTHVSALPPELRNEAYTAGKTMDFLRAAAKGGNPFFCWASFHGPHQPYAPPKHWADQYPPEKIPLPESVHEPVENLPPMLQQWRRNEKPAWNLAKATREPALYQRYIAAYLSQVSEVDHWIGRVLAVLDEAGLRDHTIVLYTSDHGDFMGRHGMVEKCSIGHNVYEETLRVPLIVSWPKRFQRGATCDSLAELVDLYPTLAALLQLERPADAPALEGRSLVPALTEGQPTGRRFAFSENYSQSTVIGERYKLGVWQDPGPEHNAWDWRGQTRDQLYDRETDPQELRNLAGTPAVAGIEKELRQALAAHIKSSNPIRSAKGHRTISSRNAQP